MGIVKKLPEYTTKFARWQHPTVGREVRTVVPVATFGDCEHQEP